MKKIEYGFNPGQRFGRWTILDRYVFSARGEKKYLCRCDCGTERVVYAHSLRGGLTKSCGCAKPVPSAGRRPKAEKTGAQSDPVGDDWMFGKMGSKGLFARRR